MPRSFRKETSNVNSGTENSSEENISRTHRQNSERPPLSNSSSKVGSNKISKEPSRQNSIQNLKNENSKNNSKQNSRNESRNSTYKSNSNKIPSGNFENDFISEVNILRNDPNLIKEDLNDFEKEIKQIYSNKPNYLKKISDLFSKIRSSKTNKIQKDEKLCLLANQYIQELKNSNSKKFYIKEHNELEKELKYDFEEVKLFHNYISTAISPRKALLDMIFNEKDLLNLNGDYLIKPLINYIGISHEKIKDIPITIVIVIDNNKLSKEKPLIEGLISEINRVRTNPQSYLKYINKKIIKK